MNNASPSPARQAYLLANRRQKRQVISNSAGFPSAICSSNSFCTWARPRDAMTASIRSLEQLHL